jgi:hypothetical protein
MKRTVLICDGETVGDFHLLILACPYYITFLEWAESFL